MTIQAVVFDIGGVLEITPDTGMVAKWEGLLHLKPGELDERLRRAWGRDGDLGRRSEEELQKSLGEITGMDQAQVDRMVGTLIDAGFDPTRISTVSPDDQAAGTGTSTDGTTANGHGPGAWLVAHLRQRGLSHEHAQRYQEHVASGRRVVGEILRGR